MSSYYGRAALGELCRVSIGRTPRRNNPRYWGGSHPWATIRDLNDGTLVNTAEGITDAALDEVMPEPIEPNTLLFSFKLSIGKMAFAGRSMYHNEAIAALPVRNAKVLDREFLFYALKVKTHDIGANHAVLGKVLNKRKVEAIEIPLPPLNEQRRIVSILNRAAKIERLRAKAQERLREFIPALFVKMFGDYEQVGIRFPCMPLREVAAVASGATKGRRINPKHAIEVPYLRVANVQDGFLNLHEVKTITIRHGEERKYALESGDLIMTEGGDPDKLGRTAVWNNELPYCAHQNHVFRVRPDREIMLTDYLRDVARSTYGKAYFLSVAKRTTGIASINKTQLGNFPVPIPPIELQNRYAELVASVSCLADGAGAAADRAASLSISLMSCLFGVDT
ncbi:MAG: restriction endonuclease subunit S [Synechococcus sp. SB0662_bin_45]|nr:restriction endonuclease subunit S [Synechococcus sp. SB0668_bin_13]MYE20906.1 restriction endonuclease subunit S [Synechococcus sp. SB0662_bin_45]